MTRVAATWQALPGYLAFTLRLPFVSRIVSFQDLGKKKMPIMLLAWQPILGRGTSKSIALPTEIQDSNMRLNFLGCPDACFQA